MRRGDYRNYYKGHMDQIKGKGGGGGGRAVWLGGGGGMGRKNNNTMNPKCKIKFPKKEKYITFLYLGEFQYVLPFIYFYFLFF